MKLLFLCICLLSFTLIPNAQLKGVLEKAKQKAANKANEQVDKTIDKGSDPSPGKTEKPATQEEK